MRSTKIARRQISIIIASLKSDTCPSCSFYKRPHNCLCSACSYKLPQSVRSRLYRRVGRGYEQAFLAALKYLGVERPYWAKPAANQQQEQPQGTEIAA